MVFSALKQEEKKEQAGGVNPLAIGLGVAFAVIVAVVVVAAAIYHTQRKRKFQRRRSSVLPAGALDAWK